MASISSSLATSEALKSMTQMSPSGVIITFSGFRSLWMMAGLRPCMYSVTWHSCNVQARVCFWSNAPWACTYSRRVQPGTSSIMV